MRFFTESGSRLSAVQELRRCLKTQISPVSLTGVSQLHKAQILLTMSQDAPVLAITADESAARLLCEDINFMSGTRTAYPYPAKELNFLEAADISREYEQLRIAALSALCRGSCGVIAASAEAVMQFTLPRNVLEEKTLRIQANSSVSQQQLAAQLVQIGYRRCEQVDAPCQFSVRGAIFDIFPSQELMPVRIEFWGDDIDSISWFEPETQRRTEQTEEILLAPAAEALPDAAQLAEKLTALSKSVRGKQAAKLKEKFQADAEKLANGALLPDIDLYFPLIYDAAASVFDYGFGAVAFCESANVTDALKGIAARYAEDVKLMLEEGMMNRQLAGYYLDPTAVLARAQQIPTCCLNAFMSSANVFSYQRMLSVEAAQTAPWGGSTRLLTEDLQESGIACAIAEEDTEPEAGKVLLTRSGLSGGFDYPDIRFACIAQNKAQSTVLKKRRFKKGQEIRALSEISEGDLVVHAGHGIGRFAGIRKLEMEGIQKDYITIEYAGGDELYVPVTQLDLVSRYIGGKGDGAVKLNKLGSAEWQKTRTNVKKAVKDMAAQLIKLYAARQKAQGFSFDPDDEIQRDFEDRFPFIETNDQLRSTAAAAMSASARQRLHSAQH